VTLLRHGLLLGAFIGLAGLFAEILASWPAADDAGLALRWAPVYALAGAVLGAGAALLAPLVSGRSARERGPGILLFGTIAAWAILAATFLPPLISDNSLPRLAPAILGLGLAAGAHLLGLAAAGSASAWRAESFFSGFGATVGLGLLLLPAALGALILPARAAAAPAAAEGASRPLNVVMVVLEGVRADHLGSLGSYRAASPRFDALAGESVLFEQAFAASPEHQESLARLLGEPDAPLAAELGAAGWQSWFVAAGPSAQPGFDRREDVLAGALPARLLLGRWSDRVRARFAVAAPRRSAEKVVERALTLAAGRDPQRPFFLLAHLSDTAPPYDPPPELRDRFRPDGISDADLLREVQDQDPLRVSLIEQGALTASPQEAQAFSALYDAEILAQDAALGALVDGLLDLGLMEDALLVVVSDHGTRFGEEDGRLGSSGSLHDAVLRVPLLLRMPRLLPAGTRAAGLVSLDDVAPAIRAVAAGSSDAALLAAARGGSPRRCVTAWLREGGAVLRLLRGEREKILFDAQDEVVAAGDLLADPDESFLRLRPPIDPLSAARWRARAAELSETSPAGGGGNLEAGGND